MVALAALLAVSAASFRWFSSVDTSYYDFLVRHHLLDYPDDIVIIAIDEASIEKLGGWPWSREYHAQLLQKLGAAEAVVFDVIFADPQSAQLGGDPVAADLLLAQAIEAHGRTLLPVFIEPLGYRQLLREVLPLPTLAAAAAGLGHAHVVYGDSGIARGVYLREGLGAPYWPHLSVALQDFLGERPATMRAADLEEQTPGSPYLIYRADYRLLRYAGPPGSIFAVSYTDVLNGLVPEREWQGKRVFVGATAKGLGDEVPTAVGSLPGVEFHANAYHTARSDAYITQVSVRVHALASAVIVLLMTALLSRLAPVQFLVGTFAAAFALVLASAAGFLLHSVWFSPLPALLAIFLFYPLWSWRRIEIALSFLQKELSVLRGNAQGDAATDPGRRAALFEDLQRQLEQLQRFNVVSHWSLEPGSAPGAALWPEFSREQPGVVSTVIPVSGQPHRFRIDCANQPEAALPVLSALLGRLQLGDDAARDSYELVERTIQEIYQAREVAQSTQRRMDESMAQLQDAVLIADAAGTVVFSNEQFVSRIGGVERGASLFDLDPGMGSLQWQDILRQIFARRENVYREVEMNSGVVMLCQAAYVLDDRNNEDGVVFVFTDVTRLREVERGKNEALAFLSHDMRSPIVSLLSLIGSHRLAGRVSGAHEQEFVDKLEFFARKNLKYSEDFLQLSRAENLDESEFQPIDMHGVVDGAYAQVHSIAQHEGIDITIARADLDCWVLGDVQLLERALTNLLRNAIQHSAAGQRVSLALEVDRVARLVVRDQGVGIDEELVPHLFEPYFRARRRQQANAAGPADQRPGPADTRGYGLGLSFVHTVVSRHGGSVRVESSPGLGASFIVELPLVPLD